MEGRSGKGFASKCLCYLLLLLSCGALHAQAQGTVTYVYTDPQGTPLAEADANGNITATYDYTPYGVTVTSMSPPPNGPGYTGQVNDPDTGFVYMQQRYYDPTTGRFINTDPVKPAAGNTFNFNRYVYGNNNPTNNVDPNGRQTIPLANEIGSDDPNRINQGLEARADVLLTVLCSCDPTYTAPAGSGELQSVVTPAEFAIGGAVSDLASTSAASFSGAASSDFSSSTLSTYRMTTEGETFSHYGFAADANKFSGGLRANSFATSASNLSGSEAKAGLALRHIDAPDSVYTVSPPAGTWVNVNPITAPQFGQPGGLPEYLFPQGTGPGTVSPPRSL